MHKNKKKQLHTNWKVKEQEWGREKKKQSTKENTVYYTESKLQLCFLHHYSILPEKKLISQLEGIEINCEANEATGHQHKQLMALLMWKVTWFYGPYLQFKLFKDCEGSIREPDSFLTCPRHLCTRPCHFIPNITEWMTTANCSLLPYWIYAYKMIKAQSMVGTVWKLLVETHCS